MSAPAIFLPLGILVASLALFATGLLWARCCDRQAQREREAIAEPLLVQIEDWTGSREAAEIWYRSYAIPELEHYTAEQLVIQGRVRELQAYLIEHRDCSPVAG